MSEIEKMKRYIERTKLDKNDRFEMTVQEAFELAYKVQDMGESLIDVISFAFVYGKAKGYRAAKAERRETV